MRPSPAIKNSQVSATMSGPRRAVFLDRDGVITELVLDPRTATYEAPFEPASVRLIDGVPRALATLRDAGYILVVASNQPAAAKGTGSMEVLDAIHERAVGLLAGSGVAIDRWAYCFHHPQGVVSELAIRCACRKPEPGLIVESAAALGIDLHSSWMVGDATSDVLAGQRAGCRTALIEHPDSAHRRTEPCEPVLRASSLFDICALIPSSEAGGAATTTRSSPGVG